MQWDLIDILTELTIAALLLKISDHFLNYDASAACGQKLKLRFFCVDAGFHFNTSIVALLIVSLGTI